MLFLFVFCTSTQASRGNDRILEKCPILFLYRHAEAELSCPLVGNSNESQFVLALIYILNHTAGIMVLVCGSYCSL